MNAVEAIEPARDYWRILDRLKSRIGQTQVKAALSVNRELVILYWEIGATIVGQQSKQGWGRSVVERLSADLRRAYPGIRGFSAQNIWYMRGFYLAWSEEGAILQQAVGELSKSEPPAVATQIPWGHNLQLISKLKDPAERLWYARKIVENGWSRAVLVHQIESGLYARRGGAVSNFKKTLPAPQSDLARELIKDPYHFDFLELSDEAGERELEKSLLDRLRDFLIELGHGFAFVGSQYHLNVGGQDFYIDLLFYHVRLHAYVVIELKARPFQPEFAGKMNFYLTAVDRQIATPGDQPAIGMILCKERNELVVEYALAEMGRPIGVAEYKLTRRLPERFKDELPTRQEFLELASWEEKAKPAAAAKSRKANSKG